MVDDGCRVQAVSQQGRGLDLMTDEEDQKDHHYCIEYEYIYRLLHKSELDIKLETYVPHK